MKTEIYHHSRYSDKATIQEIEKGVEKFLGACKDITFEDTFSVSLSRKELLHVVYQVFSDEREGSGPDSLVIDLSSGGDFPSLATVYVRKPVQKPDYKLELIKRIAVDVKESLKKRDGKAVEGQIFNLLSVIDSTATKTL
jgi:hypothetical protein